MHIAEILTADVANGPGIRVSVFVSGCRIRCKNCFQPQTWSFDYGKVFTDTLLQQITHALNQPFCAGLSILGGEPFEPENQPDVYRLIRDARTSAPHKSIWMYTGNEFEDLCDPHHRCYTDTTQPILSNIDVLICGPFIEAEKQLGLKYRGSKNQRIIDMPATLRTGSPVILTL